MSAAMVPRGSWADGLGTLGTTGAKLTDLIVGQDGIVDFANAHVDVAIKAPLARKGRLVSVLIGCHALDRAIAVGLVVTSLGSAKAAGRDSATHLVAAFENLLFTRVPLGAQIRERTLKRLVGLGVGALADSRAVGVAGAFSRNAIGAGKKDGAYQRQQHRHFLGAQLRAQAQEEREGRGRRGDTGHALVLPQARASFYREPRDSDAMRYRQRRARPRSDLPTRPAFPPRWGRILAGVAPCRRAVSAVFKAGHLPHRSRPSSLRWQRRECPNAGLACGSTPRRQPGVGGRLAAAAAGGARVSRAHRRRPREKWSVCHSRCGGAGGRNGAQDPRTLTPVDRGEPRPLARRGSEARWAADIDDHRAKSSKELRGGLGAFAALRAAQVVVQRFSVSITPGVRCI